MKTASKSLVLKVVLSLVFAISMLAFAFTVKPVMADATISMKDGASIRFGNDRPGIRFSSYVPDSYFTDGELNDGIEVGMLLVKSGLGTVSDLTVDTANQNVAKVSSNGANFVWVQQKDATIDIEGFERFNVVVTGVPDTAEALGTEIIAKSYIKDGSNVTYSTNVVTRSIARVASQVLAEDTFAKRLDGTQQGQLLNFMVASLDTADRPTATTSVTQLHFDGEDIVWGAIDGAIGYYVALGNEVKHTTETSIALSEFTATSGTVKVIGYGDGVSKSQSREWSCYVGDVPGNLANGITNGMSAATNCPPANAANYNVAVEDHADGLKVTIHDDAWRSAKFGITLEEGLDVTSHTGIVVKFKIVSNQYTASKFGLIRGGLNYNLASHSIVVANTTEWQYLYLFNSSLDALYDAGEKRMDFMFYEGGNTTSTVRTVEFVIGEIKYFNAVKLATPANLAVSAQGVVTWDAVDGADGYEVDVNGTKTPVTTNTYTLTDLSQVATIKVCATSNDVERYLTSDYAVTAFDPNPVDPNMLVDFATEADLLKLSADGKFTPDGGTAGFGTAPTMMDARVTDADNGADMKLWCRNYYSDDHQLIYDVYVNVGELDADRNIKIRFQLYDVSDGARMESEQTYFMMIDVDSKANYKNPTTLENVAYQEIQRSDLWTLSGNKLTVTKQATWFELTITSAQIKALGYEDGDTTIGFALLRTGSGHGDYNGGYGAYLRIDYIKYVD